MAYPPGPVVLEIPVNSIGRKVEEEKQEGYIQKEHCTELSTSTADPVLVDKIGIAPLLGQHTDVVLMEAGYSEEEITQLRKEEVI